MVIKYTRQTLKDNTAVKGFNMALRDRVDELVDYIKAHEDYLNHNHKLFQILEGRLLPFVREDLKKMLSESYFCKIEDRIVPINILVRLIDKLSKVYAGDPVRESTSDFETDAELLAWYEDQFEMDINGNHADEFANLFKGYTWEPYLSGDDDGPKMPKLRTLPFDRFLWKSDSITDPTKKDVFLKSMGKVKTHLGGEDRLWFAYTKDEFLPFTMGGVIYDKFLQGNDGINPFGSVPATYGNRAPFAILPTQDTDILPMSKIIPIFLTDLSGLTLFSCFSIIWGVDIDSENLTMSPNAFWSLKSDPASDKTPQVGQIKPQADIDKVLMYIKDTFSFWLETRGIKVGSMGQMTAGNLASGISKIIDELDTSEMRKINIKHFQREEQEFWQLVKRMHNSWIDQGLIQGKPRFSDQFDVSVTFDEPQPKVDRKTMVETVKLEFDSGFLDMESALVRLYPDLKPEQIDERMQKVMAEKSVTMPQAPQPQQEDDDQEADDASV